MLVFEHFLLGAPRAAALLAADFFLLLLLPALDAKEFFLELIAQLAAGKKAVGCLQAGRLALDFDPGRGVAKLHAGGGFIDLLSAGAGSADERLRQVCLRDSECSHPPVQPFPFFLSNHGGE